MGDGPDNIGNIAFGYDIHGWTTGIEARNNWGQDLVFGETLRYASPQKPGTTARYDGNITDLNRYGAARNKRLKRLNKITPQEGQKCKMLRFYSPLALPSSQMASISARDICLRSRPRAMVCCSR